MPEGPNVTRRAALLGYMNALKAARWSQAMPTLLSNTPLSHRAGSEEPRPGLGGRSPHAVDVRGNSVAAQPGLQALRGRLPVHVECSDEKPAKN